MSSSKQNQAHLCDHFAQSGQTSEEQFEHIADYRSAYGSPVLKNISTAIQCRSYDQIEAGDHTIVIGEVVEVKQDNTKAGILYYNRSYRTVGKIVPEKKISIKRAG